MIHLAHKNNRTNQKDRIVGPCLIEAGLKIALLLIIAGLGALVCDTDAYSLNTRPVQNNRLIPPQDVESLKTLAPDVGLWDGPVLYFKSGGVPLNLILIEKATQELSLYHYDGTYKLIKRYRCVTGQRHGKKRQEKDKKTPEGVFFNTKIFRDNKITIFGDRAFGLNYPDIFDELEGNGGSGIFIHGTNRALDSYSSNGCLVMRNSEVKALDSTIDFKLTPVIIGERLPYTFTGAKRDFAELTPFLKNAMLPKKYAGADTEISSLVILGMQERVVALGEIIINKAAGSENIRGYSKLYMAGPGANFLVLIRREWHEKTIPTVIAKAQTRSPKKKHTTRINPIQPLEIVMPAPRPSKRPAQSPTSLLTIETPKVVPPRKGVEPKPEPSGRTEQLPSVQPTVVAQSKVKPAQKEHPDERQIKALVESWRKAWEEKRIDDYISFYHPNFEGKKKNRAEWKQYKQILNQRNKLIRVKISDVKVYLYRGRVHVGFRQYYRSDTFKGGGFKLLEFKMDKDSWKIYREEMVKSNQKSAILRRLKNKSN
ncbi:L,D-transpeptidase family protein [Desulfococcaceae bacterium HSG9]|nr:L,D-transpeptidase family protein [Desulfococcaceae bacterium HSG9]